jgi:hypothetical protein
VRLTRRGRVVVVLAIAMLVLGALWVGTRAIGLASSGREAAPATEGAPWVTVRPGDTLWEIAHAVSADDDPGPLIRQIMELNGLSDTLIRPGSRLYLPDAELDLPRRPS